MKTIALPGLSDAEREMVTVAAVGLDPDKRRLFVGRLRAHLDLHREGDIASAVAFALTGLVQRPTKKAA
jgi:hypothetical protein